MVQMMLGTPSCPDLFLTFLIVCFLSCFSVFHSYIYSFKGKGFLINKHLIWYVAFIIQTKKNSKH